MLWIRRRRRLDEKRRSHLFEARAISTMTEEASPELLHLLEWMEMYYTAMHERAIKTEHVLKRIGV